MQSYLKVVAIPSNIGWSSFSASLKVSEEGTSVLSIQQVNRQQSNPLSEEVCLTPEPSIISKIECSIAFFVEIMYPFLCCGTTDPINASTMKFMHFVSSYPFSVFPPPERSLRILLGVLSRSLVELRPVILIHLSSRRLNRIIRNRLDQQILGCCQDTRDLGARLPRLGLQDTDAHGAVFIEGDVGVPDAGLEGDFGGLEGVVGGKDEEELEFTALK